MIRQLPANANFEHLKNDAKRLLRMHQKRALEAAMRLRQVLPQFRGLSDAQVWNSSVALHDTQLAVAREHGFRSWSRLKERVECGALADWLKLLAAAEADDAAAVVALVSAHPSLLDVSMVDGQPAPSDLGQCIFPLAVQSGRAGVVRALVTHRPDLVNRSNPINLLAHAWSTRCAPLTPERKNIYDLLKCCGAQADLVNAAKAPDLERVGMLLAGHCTGALPLDPDELANGFVTGADGGNLEVVREFLRTVPPSAQTVSRGLERAFLVNHWAVIEELLPLVPKRRLTSYLCGVCEFLNLEGLEALLRYGADPNSLGPRKKRRPLQVALTTYSRKPWRARFIETLIAAGATDVENSPQMSIHRGRPDLLAGWLDRDPNLVHQQFDSMEFPGKQDLRGGTLLHLAAEVYEFECAKLLLDRGADIDAKAVVGRGGLGGQTPIFHVVAPYYQSGGAAEPILRLFLERGAELASEAHLICTWRACRDPEGPRRVTPLGWARWHHSAVQTIEIRLLREWGALE